jgi:hypothetical protein
MQKKTVVAAIGFVLVVSPFAQPAQLFKGENNFRALAPSDLREPHRCQFTDPKVKVLGFEKDLKKKPSNIVVVIGKGSEGGAFVGFQDPEDPSAQALGYLFKQNLLDKSVAGEDTFVDISVKEDAKQDQATIYYIDRDLKNGSQGPVQRELTVKPALASKLRDTPFGKKIKLKKIELSKKGERVSFTLKGSFDVLPTKVRLPLKKIELVFDTSNVEVGRATVKLPFFISGSESWVCEPFPVAE